jgi:acyl-CoA thioesterase FadM
MARIRIELPERWHFETEFPVRIGDINFGNHLAHDAIVTLLHEARALFFKEYGWHELNIEGKGIIMADIGIMYLAEAFHGDMLRYEITARDFSTKGCDLVYRVSRVDDDREVVRAKTGIVFFDYEAREPVAIPEVFLRIFE